MQCTGCASSSLCWLRTGALDAAADNVVQAAGVPGAPRQITSAAPVVVHAGSSASGAEHATRADGVDAAGHACTPLCTGRQCGGALEGQALMQPAADATAGDACASGSAHHAAARQMKQTSWAAASMPAATEGAAKALQAAKAPVQTMHCADERSFQATSNLAAAAQQVSSAQTSLTSDLEPSGEAETCASALLTPRAAAAIHPEVAGRSQQLTVEQTSVAAPAAAASVTGAVSSEHPGGEPASLSASQAAYEGQALPPAGALLPAALEQLQELARTPSAALQPAAALGRGAPHEGPSTCAQCHEVPPPAASTQPGHPMLHQAEERITAGHAGGHMQRRRPSLLQVLCPGSAASKPACMPAPGAGAPQGAPLAPRAVQQSCTPEPASHLNDASARRASTPRASAAAAWLSAAIARAWGADGVEAGAAAVPGASGRRRRSEVAGSDEDAAVNPGHEAQAPSKAAQLGSAANPAAASAPAGCGAQQRRAGGQGVPRMNLLPPGEGWRPLLGRSGVPRPGGRAAPRLARWQPSASEALRTVITERPRTQRAASKHPPPGSPMVGLALPASVAALEALAQS